MGGNDLILLRQFILRSASLSLNVELRLVAHVRLFICIAAMQIPASLNPKTDLGFYFVKCAVLQVNVTMPKYGDTNFLGEEDKKRFNFFFLFLNCVFILLQRHTGTNVKP